MNKTTKTIFGLIVVAMAILGGFSLSKSQIKEAGPIKIGVILPLTGELAPYAEGIRNSVNMAIDNGGFADKVEVVFEDDHGCVPSDAVSAAQKLINLDKVKAFIGPMCTSATLAVTPITEENGIVVVTPSATGKNITSAGDLVFRTIASDADKSVAVAKYAYDKGYKKAALLYDISQDAVVSQRDDVKEIFPKLGGEIIAEESFITKDKDLRTQLIKIKNANPDVVFIGAMPETVALILKQARALQVQSVFASTDTSSGSQPVIDTAGASAEGLIFPFATTPTNKEYEDFVSGYKIKFGKEPSAYAAEGYDAAMVLLRSVVDSTGTTKSIRDNLVKIGNNYYGASGLIAFDQNGDVQKPMVIKVIENGKFVEAR